MDTSITQMEQDLARAGYARATQSMYVRTVEHLAERFHRPVADLTREDIRTYVDEISTLGKSAVWVTFRTKGHATETVTPVEFLRRFVQHVLPDGLHKIRHVGLYASAASALGDRVRARLGASAPAPRSLSWRDRLLQLTGRDPSRCLRCGGPLVTLLVAPCRDPPAPAA